MNDDRSSKGDIFVVDDTPDNLRLLSAILSERGYELEFRLKNERIENACHKLKANRFSTRAEIQD